jgi:hypothetical protein
MLCDFPLYQAGKVTGLLSEITEITAAIICQQLSELEKFGTSL